MARVRVLLLTLVSVSFLPLMVLFKMTTTHDYATVVAETDDSQENLPEHPLMNVPEGYLFNCSNLHSINKVKELGKGWAKTCFLGEYKGMHLAVKVVTSKQRDIKECLSLIRDADAENRKNRARCFAFPSMKFMKEVLLLQTLHHPNLVRLLGYCVRGGEYVVLNAMETADVAVFEFGEPAIVQNMNWMERLKHAGGLARLLVYFNRSPLGSLGHNDLSFQQFRIVDSTIKLTDLDAVVSYEPRCRMPGDEGDVAKQQNVKYINCNYGLSCDQGKCVGHNAIFMFKSFTDIFFKEMFKPTVFPEHFKADIDNLNRIIASPGGTADKLLAQLESMDTGLDSDNSVYSTSMNVIDAE